MSQQFKKHIFVPLPGSHVSSGRIFKKTGSLEAFMGTFVLKTYFVTFGGRLAVPPLSHCCAKLALALYLFYRHENGINHFSKHSARKSWHLLPKMNNLKFLIVKCKSC